MEIPNIDELILPFFNIPHNFYLNIFFIIISYSIYLYLPLAAYFLYKKGMTKKVFVYLFELLIGLVTITSIKYIVFRPRPQGVQVLKQLLRTDPSFPSRHSFTSLFTLWFLYPHFKGPKRVFLVAYSILVPLSTLYLGAHYPSDVIIGSILGFIFPYFVPDKYAMRLYYFLKKTARDLQKTLEK